MDWLLYDSLNWIDVVSAINTRRKEWTLLVFVWNKWEVNGSEKTNRRTRIIRKRYFSPNSFTNLSQRCMPSCSPLLLSALTSFTQLLRLCRLTWDFPLLETKRRTDVPDSRIASEAYNFLSNQSTSTAIVLAEGSTQKNDDSSVAKVEEILKFHPEDFSPNGEFKPKLDEETCLRHIRTLNYRLLESVQLICFVSPHNCSIPALFSPQLFGIPFPKQPKQNYSLGGKIWRLC